MVVRDIDIEPWRNKIVKFLKYHIGAGTPVVVIALSRKMPRFLDYLLNERLDKAKAVELKALLDKCDYTTEHAIPFVFFDVKPETEVLILDDVIFKGRTLSKVCCEVYYLNRRKKPYYLSLYQLIDAQLPQLGNPLIDESDVESKSLAPETDDEQQHIKQIKSGANNSKELTSDSEEQKTLKAVNSIPKLQSEQEAREIISDISQLVANHGLPVDMEFPILRVDGNCYEAIIQRLKDLHPDNRKYKIGNSFTQLQEDEINRLYNNDFAKIRVFDLRDQTRIVGYSPNILSQNKIESNQLFENPCYANYWQTLLDNTISKPEGSFNVVILNDIDDQQAKVMHRIHKSHAVMANYLLSLSMLIRHKSEFELPDIIKPELSESDLQLLLGKRLAKKSVEMLNRFYLEGQSSESTRQVVSMPTILTPYGEENDYAFERFSTLFNLDTIKEIVSGVFRASYTISSRSRKTLLSGSKNMNCLESFQSLYSLPKKAVRNKDAEEEINKAVDQLIDEGYVVPVYEETTDNQSVVDGAIYWRRFFRGSHIIPLTVGEN